MAGISAATSCAGSVTATTTTQTIPFVIKNIGFVITKPYVSSNVFFKSITIGQAAVFTSQTSNLRNYSFGLYTSSADPCASPQRENNIIQAIETVGQKLFTYMFFDSGNFLVNPMSAQSSTLIPSDISVSLSPTVPCQSAVTTASGTSQPVTMVAVGQMTAGYILVNGITTSQTLKITSTSTILQNYQFYVYDNNNACNITYKQFDANEGASSTNYLMQFQPNVSGTYVIFLYSTVNPTVPTDLMVQIQ
ncbi:hypothetical protein [Leptospira inadai]|uniref:hypothetical protein n=1 Tax=Leptospira inadai TaxID=29506 RepID=UPI001EE23482|nr:hypothetical protein [Leptospira inadai]